MSILYNNIALLCEKKGIKGAKLCSDIGMSKGILTDLKKGRRNGVNAVTAQKIANYFGVTVGYLLGEEEEQKEKSPSQSDELSEALDGLIKLFKQIPEESQPMVLEMIRVALKSQGLSGD